MILSQKKKQDQFLNNYPTIKVFTSGEKQGNGSYIYIIIEKVDDQEPVIFHKGLKSGFYLTPGNHKIKANAIKVKSGLFHKEIIEKYDGDILECSVVFGMDYYFGFSIKEKSFFIKQNFS